MYPGCLGQTFNVSLLTSVYELTHFPDIVCGCYSGVCPGELSIPKQLSDLLALFSKVKLYIDGNPWKEPPEAVVRKGMQAVSEYFADLFAEGVSDRRNMIKVVLVGQEGAGKTR